MPRITPLARPFEGEFGALVDQITAPAAEPLGPGISIGAALAFFTVYASLAPPVYGGWDAAELTIALILALSRKIHKASASLLRGEWDRKSFQGTQLAGKTLGLVGVGRIGSSMARAP